MREKMHSDRMNEYTVLSSESLYRSRFSALEPCCSHMERSEPPEVFAIMAPEWAGGRKINRNHGGRRIMNNHP